MGKKAHHQPRTRPREDLPGETSIYDPNVPRLKDKRWQTWSDDRVFRFVAEEAGWPLLDSEAKGQRIAIRRIASSFHVDWGEAFFCSAQLEARGLVTRSKDRLILNPLTSEVQLTECGVDEATRRWPWLVHGFRIRAGPNVKKGRFDETKVETGIKGIDEAFSKKGYMLPILLLFVIQERWNLKNLETALARMSKAGLGARRGRRPDDEPHRTVINEALKFLHKDLFTLHRSRGKQGYVYERVGVGFAPTILNWNGSALDIETIDSFWWAVSEAQMELSKNLAALKERLGFTTTVIEELRKIGEKGDRSSVVSMVEEWQRNHPSLWGDSTEDGGE